MAKFVWYDPYFSIATVDLSSYVKSMSVDDDYDAPDATAGGDTIHLTTAGGLRNFAIDVDLLQDHATSKVDQTIATIVGTAVAIEVRQHNVTAAATNPKYTGTFLVKSYKPIGGTVGEMAATRVILRPTTTVTRATS